MARLFKHGEILQIEKLDHKLAFCADGQILRNNGDGWKVWRKLKAGIDPAEHARRRQGEYADKLASKPAFARWRELVHGFSFPLRWLVVKTVSMMPEDPDGVFSELNDYHSLTSGGDLVTVDDACELCSAYRLAMEESKPEQAATPAGLVAVEA